MEETVTLSRTQLVELFEVWNAQIAEHGDSTHDDPNKQAESQADFFLHLVNTL